MHCGNPQEFPLGQCFSTFNKAYHIFYIWNPPWHTRPHKNVTQRRTISRAVMIYSECTHWPPGKGVSRLLLEDSWAWLQHACGISGIEHCLDGWMFLTWCEIWPSLFGYKVIVVVPWLARKIPSVTSLVTEFTHTVAYVKVIVPIEMYSNAN